jgi:hypothetical protein
MEAVGSSYVSPADLQSRALYAEDISGTLESILGAQTEGDIRYSRAVKFWENNAIAPFVSDGSFLTDIFGAWGYVVVRSDTKSFFGFSSGLCMFSDGTYADYSHSPPKGEKLIGVTPCYIHDLIRESGDSDYLVKLRQNLMGHNKRASKKFLVDFAQRLESEEGGKLVTKNYFRPPRGERGNATEIAKCIGTLQTVYYLRCHESEGESTDLANIGFSLVDAFGYNPEGRDMNVDVTNAADILTAVGINYELASLPYTNVLNLFYNSNIMPEIFKEFINKIYPEILQDIWYVDLRESDIVIPFDRLLYFNELYNSLNKFNKAATEHDKVDMQIALESFAHASNMVYQRSIENILSGAIS